MKKYIYLAIGLVLLVLIGALTAQGYELRRVKDERDRLQGNQNALLSDVKFYQTKAGLSAASVEQLELTCRELKTHFVEKCQEVKDLNVKVERLQSMANTGTHTSVDVHTEIKDSIIYQIRDNVVYVDTLKRFEWRDPPWVEVVGTIDGRKVDMNVCSVDTLVQVVHRVPKRFLFFKFGTKAIRQEVVSKNPHTKIIYTQYIKLK